MRSHHLQSCSFNICTLSRGLNYKSVDNVILERTWCKRTTSATMVSVNAHESTSDGIRFCVSGSGSTMTSGDLMSEVTSQPPQLRALVASNGNLKNRRQRLDQLNQQLHPHQSCIPTKSLPTLLKLIPLILYLVFFNGLEWSFLVWCIHSSIMLLYNIYVSGFSTLV